MNHTDAVVAAVLALSFLFGYRRGLVLQLVSFLSLFVAWLTAYLFYDDLAPWVGRMLPVGAFAEYPGYSFVANGLRLESYIVGAVTFTLILVGVKVGLSAAGHVLNVLVKVPGLNMLNRWSGGLLALVEAALAAAVILHLMALLPYDSVQALLSGSKAAQWAMEWLPVFFGKVKELPSSWS
ncbi:CvpA family protein [Gorillibacterium sp. sgz5001074]|uniref:CvpA family protein n=1 Tax=Gorillibacterium sp. sgz5001074 TaxID=3446695 RepID=UPI003F66F3F5